MEIVVAIPTWNDAELLRGALQSCAAAGLRSVALDGRYQTYGSGPGWSTAPEELIAAALNAPGVTLEMALPARAWHTEAEKRTALANAARALCPDWLLFLDTDERIELEPGALETWLAGVPDRVLWCEVNLYSRAIAGGQGYGLPRLIRSLPIEFRPPRDFDVYLDGRRIAWLPDEGPATTDERACVPREVLRIRHDRHLRSFERAATSAAYVRTRAENERRRKRQPSISG